LRFPDGQRVIDARSSLSVVLVGCHLNLSAYRYPPETYLGFENR